VICFKRTLNLKEVKLPEPQQNADLAKALKLLKELHPKWHCPHCGKVLEDIGSNPHVLCGAILYFKCLACNKFYRENQSGIVGRPPNLKEMQVVDEKHLKQLMSIDAFAP